MHLPPGRTTSTVLPSTPEEAQLLRPEPLSPTEEHRSLQLADTIPGASNQSPFEKYVPFITPTITNEEKARLINSGVRGLLDSRSEYAHIYDPSLDVEAEDP